MMQIFDDSLFPIKYVFFFIFVLIYKSFSLAGGQGIQNMNIFVKQFYWIHIYNIFISRLLTEYEYQIYLVHAIWPNTNIEYIHSQQLDQIWISSKFITRKLNIRIRISNIWCLVLEYSNIFVLRFDEGFQMSCPTCTVHVHSQATYIANCIAESLLCGCISFQLEIHNLSKSHICSFF